MIDELYLDILSSWKGKTVAFIGDSITYGIGTTETYHEMLAKKIGFTALNYGVNGAQITDMIGFAEKLYKEHPETDAVFVLGGTNDYNDSVPLSEPFAEEVETVNHDGAMVSRKKRSFNMNTLTFWGRYNTLMKTIRTHFPHAQLILMTPVHRGYATFGEMNVQPCELYANSCGAYIDDYADAVKRAGGIWSAPVIDIYKESGLLPMMDEHTDCFNNAITDRLHPNRAGHLRMAQVILGWMHVYACG